MAGSRGKSKRTAAAAGKAPRASKAKPKARGAGKAGGDYVYLDSPKLKALKGPAKLKDLKAVGALKTPGVGKLAAKFSGLDSDAEESPSKNATMAHGKIVRARSKANRDPASDLGAKAVYYSPAGKVEFRQG